MRRTMIAGGLVLAAMMFFGISQARGGVSNEAVGAAAGTVGADAAETTSLAGPRGRQGIGKGADLGQMVIRAVCQQWAKDNPDVQRLVDRLIADRKAVLADETKRIGDLERAIQASRAGDQVALQAAEEAVRQDTQKVRADEEQLRTDARALRDKMAELRPHRAGKDRGASHRRSNAPTGGPAPAK